MDKNECFLIEETSKEIINNNLEKATVIKNILWKLREITKYILVKDKYNKNILDSVRFFVIESLNSNDFHKLDHWTNILTILCNYYNGEIIEKLGILEPHCEGLCESKSVIKKFVFEGSKKENIILSAAIIANKNKLNTTYSEIRDGIVKYLDGKKLKRNRTKT